jgi:hypothetical protein
MLAQLHLQEAGAHLMAGDLPAAASALQRAPAALSAPIVEEVRSPVIAAWVAFLQGDLVSAGAALDRVGRAAMEHNEVAHGVGLIIANLVEAGIHLERREHEPAAALLAAARAAARINGRPVMQIIVDTWIARLATAQGDQAGALASLAQVRLALTAPDERVRAQFALEEFRIALALAPAEASALVPRLPANTASGLLQARLHVVRREWAKAGEILEEAEPLTIRERVEWGSSGAWRHRSLTSPGRTDTCAPPWRWPSLTATWPPSSSRGPASPPCSAPCRPAPVSSRMSMSCRYAPRRLRPHPRALPSRPAGP